MDGTFHVEHVLAKQHGGDDAPKNLALACDRCNLFKGPNLTSLDPVTKAVVGLFNPRLEEWSDHFEIAGDWVVGRSTTGRATVQLLQMNAPRRRLLRALLLGADESETG